MGASDWSKRIRLGFPWRTLRWERPASAPGHRCRFLGEWWKVESIPARDGTAAAFRFRAEGDSIHYFLLRDRLEKQLSHPEYSHYEWDLWIRDGLFIFLQSFELQADQAALTLDIARDASLLPISVFEEIAKLEALVAS